MLNHTFSLFITSYSLGRIHYAENAVKVLWQIRPGLPIILTLFGMSIQRKSIPLVMFHGSGNAWNPVTSPVSKNVLFSVQFHLHLTAIQTFWYPWLNFDPKRIIQIKFEHFQFWKRIFLIDRSNLLWLVGVEMKETKNVPMILKL